MSVKQGYYEQFYLQQPLAENVHFQIYTSENYFIDLTSTLIDLRMIVKKYIEEKPTIAEGWRYEK